MKQKKSDITSILIIDDNPDLIILIRKVLGSQTYHILDARDGKIGLELATAQIPDLILLDVMMPGMNGYEVCRHLKSNPVTRHVLVVLLSAVIKNINTPPGGYDCGADGYIELPVSNKELRTRIQAYINICRNNKKLGENRRLFEHIFESVQDGIVYATLTGEILAVNWALERIVEIPRSRLLGMNGLSLARKLLSGSGSKSVISLVTRILGGESVPPFQIEFREKVLEITPTIDLSGKRITGVVRDITAMVNQAKLIRESEERLRLTLDAVSDGIWDWHIPTGKAVFSPAYYTMLGYDPYAFPQDYQAWRSLVHPDDLQRTEAEIQKKNIHGGRIYG